MEYDGTAYHGFQRQVPSQPTIQETLEQALSHLDGGRVTVTGSGRTDSGVHARGQVVSFDLTWRHGTEALMRALNANLPADIAIVSTREAEPDFHPRYDARRRAYEYYVYNGPVRSPLRRQRSWHVRRPLDLPAMNEAAAALVGKHDFATFGQPPKGISTVREVYAARWRWQGKMAVFTIEGNAFLYRMVRSLVGSLKAVGVGDWPVTAFLDAFRAGTRSRAAATAPPHGLYLVSVTYEN